MLTKSALPFLSTLPQITMLRHLWPMAVSAHRGIFNLACKAGLGNIPVVRRAHGQTMPEKNVKKS